MIFLGYLLRILSSLPILRLAVVEIITSTMVDKIQIEASPAPLRFMRYIMEDTETK